MDPMYVLEPNYTGSLFDNFGLEGLLANRGLGVNEINKNSKIKSTSKAESEKDRLRTAKAREFGMTKETVGF